MAETTQIELTREQLDNGVLTDKCNHVIVEIPYSTEGATTKGGILIGFNRDVNYSEGDDSHPADLQEVWGIVYRCPQKLYYDDNDNDSMQWETEMELQVNDTVFFGIMESANAHEVLCEGRVYKILPYADMYVAKRTLCSETTSRIGSKLTHVIPLNGYVLCQPIPLKKVSELDVTSEDKIDKEKVVVRYVGKPNARYRTKSYHDFQNLQAGDIVLLERNTPFQYLERKDYMATFNGNELYLVVPRRKIVACLNK